MFSDHDLPIIFAGLAAFSVLVYAILDGYDLGVGILLPMDDEKQRDVMIASIGPFWDANETWLVMAVGLLLIAFPSAHSVMLKALYIPTTIMLIGLILRGVAFDFRAKVEQGNKRLWDKVFKAGSLIAAGSQGFMLGMYVMGFEFSMTAMLFSTLSAIGVTVAYSLIGACWLIMKCEGRLQYKAVLWARKANWLTGLGILAVCIVNPWINPEVLERWLQVPYVYVFAVVPLLCFAFLIICELVLNKLPAVDDVGAWLPFLTTSLVFTLAFAGLALSFYPYIVPGELTIWQAASAPESLRFILYGALVVIPCILAYTAFSYRVFWGKVEALRYY